MIIIDEAHKIKNPNAKITKAIYKWCVKSKMRLFLSGTLLPNRLQEMYVFAKILGRIDNNHNDFINTYFTSWGSPKSYALDELVNIYQSMAVRHLKKDVLTDLPSKEFIIQDLKSNNKQLNDVIDRLENLSYLYPDSEEFLKHALKMDIDEGGIGALQRYRSLSEEAKVSIATDTILSLVEGGRKVVVMSYIKRVQNTLYDSLSKVLGDDKLVKIVSEMSPQERQHSENQFNDNDDVMVIVCSLHCSAVGLNLQKSCQDMVFTGLDWTPGIIQQAEDRIHRVGQKSSVSIYRWRLSEIDNIMTDCFNNKIENLSVLDR